MTDLLIRVKSKEVTADLLLGVTIIGTTGARAGGAIGGFVGINLERFKRG